MAAAQTDLSIKENEDLSPDFANGPPLPIDDWPDNPLLLCVHPRHKSFIHTNYDDQIAIPFNKVFDLESKAFKGKAILRVIDMPTTDKSYFKGRRRKTDFTSQGVFKRRIRFDHVFTGQIYDRPFRHLPTPYLISTGLKIVQALAPSLKADIDCDNPHLMSPWASACQVFNICKPGDEVPLPAEPTENLELLDSKFKGMPFTERKALFHDFNELSKYYFEPGYVYTMSFYTHMFSPMQYCLHMLKMKWGIQSYMPCPMVANAIILPEDDDVAMISDSCDKLIGDTKINDKLIEEILKEKSASVDNDDNDSGNNSNSKIENDKINTNTNTNDKNENNEKNNTNKESNDDNNKSNNNKNNNNDNDSNGTSSDDIPNPGRDRNPAVDNNTQESNDDKNKNKDKEQTNNNNNNKTENNNNNSNNNEKDNNSDTDEKKGNHHKSVSEMTIDEKIDVMQSDSRDLLDCDMIYSFNIWHVKLVDELYNGKYSIHQKGTNSNSNSNDNNNNNNNDNSGKTRSESFSLFGSKKKSSMDNNTGQSKSHDLPNSGNSGNGSENVDDNNSNDTSDGSKSKSILGSMFGKRWS